MARKAVASTLAAVVLFTVLVVADATVMSAQQNLAATAQVTHLESREQLLEQASMGVASLQALAQLESYLSSNPADCPAIQEYLASLSAEGSSSGVDSGISYSTNATASLLASPAPQSDNLTVASPFAGYSPTAADFRVTLSVEESSPGGAVTLSRREAHVLNLPISPGAASSLCGSSLASLAAALSRSPCNATSEEAAFDSVLPGLESAAAAVGFSLTAGWAGSGACAASYWVTLVEDGVAGPAGSFDWTVLGSGSTA